MSDQLEMLIDSLDHTSIVILREYEKALKHIHLLEEENSALRQQLTLHRDHSTSEPGVEPGHVHARIEEGTSSASNTAGEASGNEHADASMEVSAQSNEPDDANNVNVAQSNTSDAQTDEESVQPDEGVEQSSRDEPESSPSNVEQPDADKAEHPADNAPSPQALLKEWYKRYPQAFFTAHTSPLKVGIHKDLIEREPWPAKLIRRALANYVNLPRYLKSVRMGVQRVDLDGQAVGAIGEEDVQHAREQLELLQMRRREREERQAAERMSRKLEQLSTRLGH